MSKQLTLISLKPHERDILRACRDYLRLTGWFVIRNHQGLGAHRGLSDLTCIKDGRVLWVETKTPQGRLSQYQQGFKRDIESRGGTYLVITDVDDLAEYLERTG